MINRCKSADEMLNADDKRTLVNKPVQFRRKCQSLLPVGI